MYSIPLQVYRFEKRKWATVLLKSNALLYIFNIFKFSTEHC